MYITEKIPSTGVDKTMTPEPRAANVHFDKRAY